MKSKAPRNEQSKTPGNEVNRDSDTNPIQTGLAEEADLWALRDTSPQAREELVRRYLAFAKSLAVRYRSQTESLDDLVQVACLGLVNAINRFDPERGIPFIAFASPTITGELKRHFRDRTSTMRLPRSLYDRIGQIDLVVSDLTGQLNREPSVTEIATEMNTEEHKVVEAFEAGQNRHLVSLDCNPVSSDGDSGTFSERFGEEDANFDTAESRIVLHEAMSDLSNEEQTVIRLRFREELTQSEIADRIGHSQMHVSRMLRRILDRMNKRIPAAA